jgi:hypothetical protein
MKRATGTVIGLVIAAVLVFFAFAPVVHTTTPPPIPQLAFIGPQPAYESLSCVVLGVGTGYWQTTSSTNSGAQWSYQMGCPPPPATNVSTVTATSCSTFITSTMTLTGENGGATTTMTVVAPVC